MISSLQDTLSIGTRGRARVTRRPGGKTLRLEAEKREDLEFIDRLVVDLKTTGKKLRERVLRVTRAKFLYDGDVDRDLEGSLDVYKIGKGLVGLKGRLLRLFRFFESEFLKLAEEFKAEEHHYPVMLPLEVLEELRYLEHFPQHVTFCSHLPGDLALLQRSTDAVQNNGGRMPQSVIAKITRPAHVLQPAVCLPCYRQMRGLVVESRSVLAITMQNHVFRYEGENLRLLKRLWDFSVRDIVFFGAHNRLAQMRSRVIDRTVKLCRELDLEVRVQLANDPFFLEQSRNKKIYQRMGEVKYELVIPLRNKHEEVAASSFNLHHDFYTKLYDIRLTNRQKAESACMGFGIDRWLYGFLAQKGLDPTAWPEKVARYCK